MDDSIARKRARSLREFTLLGLSEHLDPWDRLASSAVIYSLAIALPLLQLLGENPEFFVAHSASGAEVIVIGLVVGIVLPLIIGAVVSIVARVIPRVGWILHMSIVSILGAVLWIHVLEGLGIKSLVAVTVLGILFSLGLVALYLLFGPVRWAVRVLGVLIPTAIILNFVFISRVAGLVLVDNVERPETSVAIVDRVPIVMIIFDELPLASLIDAEGSIQADLYPNFSRLAEDSLWFRNAVTVESVTVRALPAILTGHPVEPGILPTVSNYPDNLLTFLGSTYDTWAIEPVADLCPVSICNQEEPAPPTDRWLEMLSDLKIVSLHLTLPEGWTRGLPPIDESWAGFESGQNKDGYSLDTAQSGVENDLSGIPDTDRAGQFEQFLENLEKGASSPAPTFNFAHVVLPHGPWEYLPDGRLHGAPSPPAGRVGKGWSTDEWLVSQVYQRHLLQVQFTDRLLGLALDRMVELGIYDESLLLVMADHGVSFQPGIKRPRLVTDETIGEIAAVPLFVKVPGGELRGVDEYRAELSDVVATVADVIGAEPPWRSTGYSLMSEDRPKRTESSIDGGAITYGVSGEEKLSVAARKLAIFHDGNPFELAPDGLQSLLGTPVTGLEGVDTAKLQASVTGLDRYDDVDLASPWLPAHLSGSLTASDEAPPHIAVSLNGRIVAVTRAFLEAGLWHFEAMLPPDRFDESNDIGLYLVESNGGEPSLSVLPVSHVD